LQSLALKEGRSKDNSNSNSKMEALPESVHLLADKSV
jgi:hypothetical protein